MITKMVKNVLLWSYERGSWQYDVLCILILAFIFLTPSDWFHKPHPASAPPVTNQKETATGSRTSPDNSRSTEKDKNSGESEEPRPPSRR